MKNVRDVAADILMKIENDNSYSNLSLADISGKGFFEDRRDTALLSSLVYGVLEHKFALDHNISLYLTSPLKKLHPRVLCILRLGALQILYMDKIPPRAAVNEAVASAKRLKVAYASALINAVLRKISDNGIVYPDRKNMTEYLSVRYSCPVWLVSHFTDVYGEDTAEYILSAFEGRKPLFCRLNPLADFDVATELEKDGTEVTFSELENCVSLKNTGDVTGLSAFVKGGFHVQDKSSQICCKVLDAKPGEVVVDCCAAPGGKTFTTAEYMENRGVLWSNDIFEHKTELIRSGAERLGLTCIKTVCSDAVSLKNTVSSADRVLCDVPCSGFGVIGRRPEIKYKSMCDFDDLPDIQYAILDSCSEMVKQGGTLVYSTCTLSPRENENVCDRFLSFHPGFEISSDGYYADICGSNKYKTFLPDKNGGDGFFIAKFKRVR